MNTPQNNIPYLIPGAIIIAGLIVAGAVFVSQKGDTKKDGSKNTPPQSASAENVKPITANDHLLGSPSAAVTIIEFSDLECPFCKVFHQTMKQIVDVYGKDGQVAWVYRHFPLDSIHPKSRKESEASECAAEQGGNVAFWNYVDGVFAITPSNNGLDMNQLPVIAKNIGLDVDVFQSCLDSGKYASHISENLSDAIASGGTGTPYSIIITPKGGVFPFSGALTFEQVKGLLEQAFKN
ncbi:MAG: thioredoxin domain-containing protein [Parcubacteria group bacterium]|nr:thioredoxin domain-containing protein [Parcubacteria group bacterium]